MSGTHLHFGLDDHSNRCAHPMIELPDHPAGVPWPTEAWPRGDSAVVAGEAFQVQADGVFALAPEQGVSYVLAVVHRGRLVYERYAAGASPIYLQYSWSMAKSITHALIGILVGDGRLELDAPAPVSEWDGATDPRRDITLDHLLKMRSGLIFNEDYVDGARSDVIEMLTGSGRKDTGAFAAAKPPAAPAGTLFNYSSGTTNILCRILRDTVGGGVDGMLAFMRGRLFEPIGMRSPLPHFDASGTFVGSSFCLAAPEDFLRFGLLYLRDGVWDGTRILPPGWVDHARTPSHTAADEAYGAHWWLRPDRLDWFYASGYDGQRTVVVPEKDLLIFRAGRTNVDFVQPIWDRVYAMAELF